MRKRLLVCAFLFAVSTFAYGAEEKADVSLLGFDFFAPVVFGTGSVSSPRVGEIVYDAQNSGFYGYGNMGNWVNMSVPESGDTVRTTGINYDIQDDDGYDAIVATAVGITIKLPDVAANKNRRITIKRLLATAANGEVTIDRNGATIDGNSANYILDFNSELVTLESEGTNWIVVSKYVPEVQYDQTEVTVTGCTGLVITRAVFVPYKTINGVWRLKANIRGGSMTSTTSCTISIAGITFSSNTVGSAYVSSSGTTPIYSIGGAGTDDIEIFSASSFNASAVLYFDAELSAKPTFVE